MRISVAVLACALVAACSPSTPETAKSLPAEAPQPAAVAAAEPVHAVITLPVAVTPSADFDARVAALRSVPGVANVLVLNAEPGQDGPGFAALAVVDFKDEASLNGWISGAGSDAALKVRRADVLVEDIGAGAADVVSSSSYVVNHYQSLVTPAEYKVFAEKYVAPNMAYQRSSGAMLAYTMYIEREPEGVKPMVVLVKQYVSPSERVRSEAAKVTYKRDVLLKQPEWKQLNDARDSYRVDLTHTVARPLTAE
jgi:hypothetical protein